MATTTEPSGSNAMSYGVSSSSCQIRSHAPFGRMRYTAPAPGSWLVRGVDCAAGWGVLVDPSVTIVIETSVETEAVCCTGAAAGVGDGVGA